MKKAPEVLRAGVTFVTMQRAFFWGLRVGPPSASQNVHSRAGWVLLGLGENSLGSSVAENTWSRDDSGCCGGTPSCCAKYEFARVDEVFHVSFRVGVAE